MVIVGVGVNHDSFVKSVEKAFCPCKPNICSEPAALTVPEPDTSVAQYTGGYLKVSKKNHLIICNPESSKLKLFKSTKRPFG